jgi:hypothetical protein
LLELLYLGPEHRLRRIVSSSSVQDLNRAAPATFRTQIEQTCMHLEQLQIRFKKNRKFERFLSLSLRKLKIKEILFKNLNIRHLISLPLSGDSNLMTQSL